MRRALIGLGLVLGVGLGLFRARLEASAERTVSLPDAPTSVVVEAATFAPLRLPPAWRISQEPAPLAPRDEPRGTLSGVIARVIDPEGRTVAPAELVLFHGSREVARAVVDRSGRAHIAGLVPGRYFLGLEPESLNGRLAVHNVGTGSSLVSFRLERGRTSEVVLTALRAATLEGVALDATGAPIVGATILLQSLDAGLGLPSAKAATGERGAFLFDALHPGTYRTQVSWPEGAGAGGQPVPQRLTLAAGELARLVVRAEPEPRSIHGRLVDAEGRPIADVVVQCELSEADGLHLVTALEAHAPWSRVLARARTDAEGRYRLEGLPRALVMLRAAPRIGSSLGFRIRAPEYAEILAGRFDLRTSEVAVDAGKTALAKRN